MTLPQLGKKLLTGSIYAITLILVLFAIALSLLRTFLPQLDSWKQELETLIEQRTELNVSLGQLGADWLASGPVLLISDLQITPQADQPLALQVQQAQIQLDFWRSVRALTPYFEHIEIQGVELELTLSKTDNTDSEPSLALWRSLLLEHFTRLKVRDLSVQLHLPTHSLSPIYLASLHWRNESHRHLAEGRLYLDQTKQQAETLTLALELTQRFDQRLFGRAHLKAEQLDIGNWLTRQFADPLHYQGVLNLEAWASFDESGLGHSQLRFGNNIFAWQQGNKPQALTLQGGDLIWSPQSDPVLNPHGLWGQLTGQDLKIATNGQLWPDLSFYLRRQPEQTALWLSQLPAWGLAPFLGVLPVSDELRDQLVALEPSGQLGPLKVQQVDTQWQATLPMVDLAWRSAGALPGVNALTGQLTWQQNKLDLNLQPKALTLDWPEQWPQPLSFDQFGLSATWHSDSNQVVLQQLELNNADLQGQLRGGLAATTHKPAQLQLLGDFTLKQARNLKHYYPRKWMGGALSDYLGQAIKKGHSEQVQLLWHGALSDFPYAQHDGIFLTEFEMQNLDFAFLPDWPTITNGRVAAQFKNAAMDLQIKQGKLGSVALNGAYVGIPHLGNAPELVIKGQVKGNGKQARQALGNSFLADSLGSTLKVLSVTDRVPVTLDMRFPLGNNPQPALVQGQVDFDQTNIKIVPLDLTVKQVKGRLSFRNAQIKAEQLRAQIYNQPSQISLKGGQHGAAYGVDLKLSSNWDLAKLPKALDNPLMPMLTGQSRLRGDLALKVDNAGVQYRGEFHSDLAGISIDLPSPVGKANKTRQPLVAALTGDQHGGELNLLLGSQAQFRARLDYDAPQKVAGYQLAIGEKAKAPTRSGGYLYWSQLPIAFEQWLPLISQFAQVKPTTATPLFAPLQAMVLNSPQLSLWSAELGSGQFNGLALDDGWLFEGNSDGFIGHVHLGSDPKTQGITLDANRLAINMRSEPDVESEPDLGLSADWISKLPRLDLEIVDLKIDDLPLGHLTLSGHQQGENYQFDQIRLHSQALQADLIGAWSPIPSSATQTQTLLQGTLQSADLTQLAKQLKRAIALRDSKANVTVDLNWRGAPWQWQLDQFSGNTHFNFDQGYVAEISDRGGRLLSIFSVESLLRRFTLDFGDLFTKGLHYSEFSGDLTLNNGVIRTDNTLMDAAIGKIWMTGDTDLNTHKLDYNVSFAPALTSNLPAVMLLTTGAWPLSLGTFAVTKLLEPVLEVVTKVDYHLGGTLSEPKFTEPKRSMRQIKLSERNR